jgi:hypothetical protein
MAPRVNVIKLSGKLLPFCVSKQYYHSFNFRKAVYNCGKKFYNIGPWKVNS